MKLIVDHSSRFAKMRAHTSTHLLHAQLANIFPNTKQEGSLVDNDLLRFDFAADRLLDPQELANIEKKINQIIYLACDVTTQEMSIDDAAKLGAKMFFEDKYGDKVRVVQITCHSECNEEYNLESNISTELCGGTHVSNTKDIGCFAILSQEAVASGIKRITAITGPRVSEKIQDINNILDTVLDKLGIKTITQLKDKLDKILKENKDLEDEINNYQDSVIKQAILVLNKNIKKEFFEWFDAPIRLDPNNKELQTMDFKKIFTKAIEHYKDNNILLFRNDGSFGVYFGKKNASAKEFLNKFGLKGGGNDNIVQGRDPKVLELF